MKMHSLVHRVVRGNALVCTLVFTAIVAILLMAYLQLVSVQNRNTARSQAWNASIAVIEAGVEDALAHLNAHGATNLACDNWSQDGNLYWVKRRIGDGEYLVTISNYFGPGPNGTQPIIESRGYLAVPAQLTAGPGPVLATAATLVEGKPYVARGVRVKAKGHWLFEKGMVAKGQIDLKGNDVDVDSYDSTDSQYSTDGRYDETKRKAGGDVATNSSLTNSLNAGNANIYGHVSTGPDGSIKIGTNGVVGDLAWHEAGNLGIQAGASSDDMNVDFNDVTAPYAMATIPGPGFVNGVWYDYVLGKGNWYLSGFDTTDKKMIVTGAATLVVSGNIKMSGQSSITIATNASLKLYMKGAMADLGGNGVINQTGYATNFYYYGLPSNKQLDIGGNAAFTGVVYAPSADLRLNGSGNSITDFSGATITKTVTMNGHFKFHYDESLRKYGPFSGFVIQSWNEMTPQEVAYIPVTLAAQ